MGKTFYLAAAARGRARRKLRARLGIAALMVAAFGGTWIGADWLERAGMAPLTSAPVALRTDSGDMSSARFGLCHTGGGTNCVVDGDTFWFAGVKYRIADIDTPETHGPHCAEEAALGARATERLQSLLNAGPFTLASVDRDTDRYGRKLRVVTRDGASLGGTLVDEGLAREWGGRREPWC
ncbi:MAG: nuclease [Sphingobium sp.]|nr:MAG: nuclease [Sphingobium sp.]